jgi:hypothetical protein
MIEISELQRLLGAYGDTKDRYVCVFVPSLTRDGSSIDHEFWRSETVRVLSRLFGGATSVHAYGGWLDAEMGDKVKEESVSLVVSFFSSDELSKDAVLELKRFVHRMGREAQQGEIGILLGNRFLRFRRFDYE